MTLLYPVTWENAMGYLEYLTTHPRELARQFTLAVARGCPPEVDECEKDKAGWDACDECFYKWLMSEVENDAGLC